jgi:ACR3 family arsenite efflux pump ArsB
MQVLGLEPIIGAILITVAGVTLSVLLGWLKGDKEFNIKQVVASALIAFVVSAQIVIVQLQAIPDDITQLAASAILFALVGQVAGIDSISKSAAQAVAKARKSN